MAANEAELRDCLDWIGWNVRQSNAIVAEGFSTIDDIGEMLLKDVSHVCTAISVAESALAMP
jgi:hypothetical protein